MRRFLLVEDSESELRLIERLIHRACRDPCTVDAVMDGRAAQFLLRQRQYDAVIADVHLKNDSGIDVCEDARQVQPEAKRIIMTADPSIETLQDALSRGRVHTYLSKGWGSARMLAQLELALE